MDYLSIVRPLLRLLRAPRSAMRSRADASRTPRPQQALLFKRTGLTALQQTRLFFRYTKRLA
jgi:hypothetical protein